MTDYFEQQQTVELTKEELEKLSHRINVQKTQIELFSANGGTFERADTIIDAPDKCIYPKPPTKTMAENMFLAGELSLREFEQTLEVALNVNGVNWGVCDV